MPVYNSELYLNDCLNSIRNQSFIQFECIMINDGSEDDSEQICQEFVNKDQRFQLINQVNSGASAARNKGLSLAVGEYITFVDR